MFNLIAEAARRFSVRARERATRFQERARHANARAEFWGDVQAWADGLASWDDLSRARWRRLKAMPRPMSRGEAELWLAVWGGVALLACGVLAGAAA